MSVQSEIDRLNTAKSDIVSAIEEKSVEVPESARLSDVSEYIKAIPLGTEMFVVTLTVDTEKVYTSDKSAASIVAAHNSGKIVIAIEQGSSSTVIKYNLTGYASGGTKAYFDGYIDDNTIAHITINDRRGQTDVDYYETVLAEADTLSDYVKTVNGNAPDDNGNVTVSMPNIPTKVSDLTNDSGFLTLSTLPKYGGETV